MLGYERELNDLRRSLGCEPIVGNTVEAWRGAAATVMLVSPTWFGRSAPDWPPIEWGGFSSWTAPASHAVDPAVDAYLDAGDPPVLVTLGTSAAAGAGVAFADIAHQLDRLGLRSLLLVGDPRHLDAVGDRPGAFTFAPVEHVLPRCRLTVCSGALGTLAASLRHAKPVVVLPQLFDQVWHGGRAETLGVGRLTRRTSRVGAAVEQIVQSQVPYRRAEALAETLRTEDGGRALADAVERVLEGAA